MSYITKIKAAFLTVFKKIESNTIKVYKAM